MMPMTPRRRAGFSLVELLVSMAIGLVLTLAIASVLLKSEGAKRSTTAVNDINQSGAYAAYVLDRVIRSAGSGYAQRWREVFGCPLVAAKTGTGALNFRSSTWTGGSYSSQTMVLAPVLIGKDQADKGTDKRGDLITVMAGTAGYSEAPQAIVSTLGGTPPSVNVANPTGYQLNDLVLLADQSVPAGCMVEQLSTPSTATSGALPLAGSYYNASGTGSGSVSVSSFGTGSYLVHLGSADATRNNPPEFITFGVTDNRVLSAYDMLNLNTPVLSDIGDGVLEMHALYGLDVANGATGTVQSWVAPTGSYDIASLLGTGQQANLRRIIAIRVGLILRSAVAEKDPVPQPASLTLFADLPGGVSYTRAIATSETVYRFRTLEFTVPLRNVVLAQ